MLFAVFALVSTAMAADLSGIGDLITAGVGAVNSITTTATTAAANSDKRRRRLAGGMMTDNVCSSIGQMIKRDTQQDIVGLVSRPGEDQHMMISKMRKKIANMCEMKNMEGSKQCAMYAKLLDMQEMDDDDSVSKAAWMDAMGSERDHAKMCKMVTQVVNAKLMQMSKDPNSPVEIRNGQVYRINRNIVKDDGVSCTVTTGVAGAIVAGASMVGVVLGSLCKTWNEQSVPLLAQSV